MFSSNLIAQEVRPSFSCKGKLNYSEMTICSDSYLSSLDHYLTVLYKQYRAQSFSVESLKKDQIKWWKKRNSCKNSSCIVEKYNTRITEIINGISRIDSEFQALNPRLVRDLFEAEKARYSRISILETIDKTNKEKEIFPKTFFNLVSANISSFKRLKANAYEFKYTYYVSYKSLPEQRLSGSFIVDESGSITSVKTHKNSSFDKLLDDISKASLAGREDHLEIMRSVLVELRSEGINTSGKFLKYFEMKPVKTLSGTGEIPCSRHDDQLFLVKGSVLRDIIDCSWGHEIIDTYDGNDEIEGSWGDEIIAAGSGNDKIDGSWGDEMIYAGPGNDSIKGSHGSLILLYGASWGNDVISGGCSLIVFSADNTPENILWEDKRIILNKKTGDRIKLSRPCENIHFSHINFD